MKGNIDKVRDTIVKYCERASKEFKTPSDNNLQVRFELNPFQPTPEKPSPIFYSLCEKYAEKAPTTFGKIYNFILGYDALGIEKQVVPLIVMSLGNTCNKLGLAANELYVFASPKSDFYEKVTDDDGVEKYVKEPLAILILNRKTNQWVGQPISLSTFVMDNLMDVMEQQQKGAAQ